MSHEFSLVTDTDHRSWLWVAVICCTVCCPAFLLFRGVARYRKYGLDDLAIVVSFVFVMIHSALLMGSLHLGFGVLLTPVSRSGILEAAKLVFASRVVLSIVLWTSKLSALLLIRRLIEPGGWRTIACNVGIGLITVWCIFAVLATSISCSPSHTLFRHAENACQHLDIRISTMMAFNIATELGVFGLAMAFLKNMRVEPSQRYQVLATFVVRLANIGLSIGFLVFYLEFLCTGHSSIGFIPTAIVQEVLASCSFISSISSSFFSFPLPDSSSSSQPKTVARRLSTPMSCLGDKMRGDRNVFKHRARIYADAGDVEARKSSDSLESQAGIVRLETFKIESARCSAANVLDV